MLFSSIPFLYYFLPIVLILYFVVPSKLKNTVLLVSSLFFYAWGEPKYVFLMITTIIVGFVLGILIEKYRGNIKSKIFMILSVVICIGFLGYFKYADFFIDNFNKVTGLQVPLLRLALPIGISFYTFQILSYTLDVFMGNVKAQRNPFTLGAYITMFPQLIAGPIVRYSDIEAQLQERTHSIDKSAEGITRFTIGLGKKILIANTLGEICTIFASSDDKSILFYWIYAIAFSMQIYFDFSGYSDMAIGLGKILGFDFLENFNYPFISRSISEFWRRWHMSLGYWFRDYVYIPMGGSRVSNKRYLLNVFTVWFLTGFWHGASWNFIIWGLYFALFLIIEKFFIGKFLKDHKVLSHIYVIFFVIISFVIFNATNLSDVFTYVGGMFGIGNVPFISDETVYYLRSYLFVIIAGIIGATPYPKNIILKLKKNNQYNKILNIAEIIVVIGLIIIVTAFLVDGSFNPFLYFRF